MDAKTFDKAKLPSRHVTEGPARAPQAMRALLDGGYLHEDCLTVTGKTLKQNLEKLKFNKNQKVVYPVSTPISKAGGVAGLQGSLALVGAIVKVAGMTKLQFRGPARALGGPIALIENRDMISIDAEKVRLDLEVPKAELAKRRKAWKAPANPYHSGVLRKYADQVGPARKGAVTHAGGKAEVICYADI